MFQESNPDYPIRQQIWEAFPIFNCRPENGDIPRKQSARMGLAAEVVDITKYPLTTGPLREINVRRLTEDFSNLVH
jgi:hypothetical protein